MNIEQILQTTKNNVGLGIQIERARIIGKLNGMHPAFDHNEEMCFVCEVIMFVNEDHNASQE